MYHVPGFRPENSGLSRRVLRGRSLLKLDISVPSGLNLARTLVTCCELNVCLTLTSEGSMILTNSILT